MGRVPDCLAASRLVREEEEVTRNSRNPGTRVTRQVTEPRLTQHLQRVKCNIMWMKRAEKR